MRRSPASHAILALLFSALVGCAANSDYLYAPRTANATDNGLPSVRTPIPPDVPAGAVQVTSYGIADVGAEGESDVPMLIVRMAIDNTSSATPLTVDTREERVHIAGEGESRAAYVNTDLGTLPSVAVAQGERRVLDFYFPLPDGLDDATDVPGFEFLWQIRTASATVPGRATFDRELAEPSAVYAEPGPRVLVIGWGSYWWYDPLYPRVVFVHPRPFIVYHRRPGRVEIRRAPRGHYRGVAAPPRGGVHHAPARNARPHR